MNAKVLIIEDDREIGEIEHIFEPFYRRTNSRNEPGTGLGLSIVRLILNSHGWDITASSVAERGAQFRIRIKQSL